VLPGAVASLDPAKDGVREDGPATIPDEISPRIADGRGSDPASSAPVPLHDALSSHAALAGRGPLRALARLGPMSSSGSLSLYRSSSGQNLERAATSGLTAPLIQSGGGSGIFAKLLLEGIAIGCLLTVAASTR
jgi:hypothetical protein